MLDTDVVIAALDRGDSHHRRAAKRIEGMIDVGDELLLSTINYAEALVRPAEDVDTLKVAVDAIAALEIRLIPPSAAIARDAARIRWLGVSLADGFALATAQERSATLASFDRRVRRAMKTLRIAAPKQLG